MFLINWINEADGAVDILANGAHARCRDLYQLGEFMAENGDRLNAKEARLIGIVAFYFAIRDFGSGPPCSVLNGASKGLDSAYVVVQDEQIQRHVDDGIESVRDDLFPIRTGAFDEILSRAYHYMRSQLLE